MHACRLALLHILLHKLLNVRLETRQWNTGGYRHLAKLQLLASGFEAMQKINKYIFQLATLETSYMLQVHLHSQIIGFPSTSYTQMTDYLCNSGEREKKKIALASDEPPSLLSGPRPAFRRFTVLQAQPGVRSQAWAWELRSSLR